MKKNKGLQVVVRQHKMIAKRIIEDWVSQLWYLNVQTLLVSNFG